jgi:catechol 2,3-dioxygenase-like lactoylglutathione lyase family enzyme
VQVTTVGPIAQIHISVDDIDRAVAFYRDALGLPLLFQVPGQPMAFIDCHGVRLYLGRPESPGFRSSPILYFRVVAIEEAVHELQERGVAFLDAPHVVHRDGASELWMAFFRDPDGNALALMEERPL